MRMEPIDMDKSMMITHVQTEILKLSIGYESIFKQKPGREDIAYVCKDELCGWWTDDVNKIIAREIEVPAKDGMGGIDPSHRATAVILACPDCKHRVMAVAMHIWKRKQGGSRRWARKDGEKFFQSGKTKPTGIILTDS